MLSRIARVSRRAAVAGVAFALAYASWDVAALRAEELRSSSLKIRRAVYEEPEGVWPSRSIMLTPAQDDAPQEPTEGDALPGSETEQPEPMVDSTGERPMTPLDEDEDSAPLPPGRLPDSANDEDPRDRPAPNSRREPPSDYQRDAGRDDPCRNDCGGEPPYYPKSWEVGAPGVSCCGCVDCVGPLGYGSPGHVCCCDPCCAPCDPYCLLGVHGWLQLEYGQWWTDGLSVPALVTNGVLPNAAVLFGNEDLNDDARSGGRVRLGLWLDDCGCWSIEGEYLGMEQQTTHFEAASSPDGRPFLARPAIDPDGLPAVILVAQPDEVAGSVSIDAATEFDAAAVRIRRSLLRKSWACPDVSCAGPLSRDSLMLDFLVGYQHLSLDEQLTIHESKSTLGRFAPGPRLHLNANDLFDTENNFTGGELGLQMRMQKHCWTFEALGKLGLGQTEQRVFIAGNTVRRSGGQIEDFGGGTLALDTNIGRYKREEFSVVPEAGLTVGYWLTPCWRATVGYSVIYWDNVVRPGEQIDMVINPVNFPPNPPGPGDPERPAFEFQEGKFWAQSLSFGLERRW